MLRRTFTLVLLLSASLTPTILALPVPDGVDIAVSLEPRQGSNYGGYTPPSPPNFGAGSQPNNNNNGKGKGHKRDGAIEARQSCCPAGYGAGVYCPCGPIQSSNNTPGGKKGGGH